MLKSVKFFKVSPLRKQFKSLSTLSKNSIQIILSEEVRHGIENSLPIVALESTIITHGMPYPRNIESALEVEEEIRKKDVIPATVAVIRGQIKAGLSEVEISELGDTKSSQAIKTSRRDLAYIISNKLNGGTTVSATLIIARKAGIPIFATGGLGGVHREGEKTLDVSADLTELGRTSVAVFSSGIKSILDIPKTLEYLETQGVFVATFGDTKDFPGFYCSKSGYAVPYNVNDAKEAACIIKHNRELCLDSGMLFGVPVPEEYSLNKEELDEIIKNGLTSAKRRGVIGKELTPFLLSWVAEATQGKSLTTNVALVKNNARIAADVAVELSQMRGRTGSKPVMATGNEDNERNLEKRPVVIGGCVLDRCAILDETDIKRIISKEDDGISMVNDYNMEVEIDDSSEDLQLIAVGDPIKNINKSVSQIEDEENSSEIEKIDNEDNKVKNIVDFQLENSEKTKKDFSFSLNEISEKIQEVRSSAKKSLNKQAEKMLRFSKTKFQIANVGETVRIRIPEVDRAKAGIL